MYSQKQFSIVFVFSRQLEKSCERVENNLQTIYDVDRPRGRLERDEKALRNPV